MKERNYIKLSVEIKKTFGSNIIEQILKNKAGNTSIQLINNRFETKLAEVFQDISCMNRGGKNGDVNLKNASFNQASYLI